MKVSGVNVKKLKLHFQTSELPNLEEYSEDSPEATSGDNRRHSTEGTVPAGKGRPYSLNSVFPVLEIKFILLTCNAL